MRTFMCFVLLSTGCGRTGPWWFDNGADGRDFAVHHVDGSVDMNADLTDAAFHACMSGALTIAKAEPTVMFVLDRSGSMNTAFGDTTRWRSLTQGLASALPAADSTLATGGLLFPVGNNMSAGCTAPSSAALDPALGNANALVSLMEATQPSGETPTSDALSSAAAILLGLHTATTARAIVLATDGAPNCNAALDPSTCTCATTMNNNRCKQATQCLDDTRTVGTVTTLAKEGLPTYVIGIADTSEFVSTLNAMAVAGGRAKSGATAYYAATSPMELSSALVQIRDQVGACEYLVSEVPTDGEVVVSVDGTVVPYDPTAVDGWSWRDKSNGQLVIDGEACATLAASGTAVVTAQAICNDR